MTCEGLSLWTRVSGDYPDASPGRWHSVCPTKACPAPKVTLDSLGLCIWWEYMSSVSVCAAETIVNVLDFKKDVGLWHGILTVSATPCVLAGLHATAGIRVCVQGGWG